MSFCGNCKKISSEGDISEDFEGSDREGLFRVLSNALYFLEKKRENSFSFSIGEICVFLVKLLSYEGIHPQIHRCIFSDTKISKMDEVVLLNEQGGFSKLQSVSKSFSVKRNLKFHQILFHFMSEVSMQKYQEIDLETSMPNESFNILLDYSLYQLNLNKKDIHSLSLLT